MEQDFQILLGLMIDESDLSDIQKRIAKEKINLNANISIEDFSKSKLEMEKQIASLGTYIKTTLGDAVTDKQANKWAKKYYDSMISGAKQATKEQEKLNDAQKKDTLATQKKYYENIINTNKQLYSLKSKLLTSDETQTTEINKQVKALERRNKYYSSQITKKGLTDNAWEKSLNDSKNVLENELKINKAKLVDTSNSKNSAEQEKLANSMSKVREQAELARQAEEKRQTVAQNNAINKNIEQEFIQREKLKTQIDEINKTEQLGTNKSKVYQMTNDLKSYTNESKLASEQISSLQNAHNKFLASQSNLLKGTGNETDLINSNKLLQEEYTKTSNVLKQLSSEGKKLNQTDLFNRTKGNSLNKIDNFLKENSALTDTTKNKILELRRAIESTDDSKALRNLNAELTNVQRSAKAAGETGRNFGDEMKNNFRKFSQWVGASTIFFGMQRAIKGVIGDVKELDTEMTSLKKVTEATDAQFENFLVQATTNAKLLGASITEIVKSASEFSRLGYNLPDATELSRVATLYKNVGDGISIEDASSSIISTMKAYNIQASDAESIVDKFNKVGNEFSISSAGIGDALKRSASALKEANNDLSQSIALQVGANNVIQDEDVVGTMWKSVALRIRGKMCASI